MRRDLRLRRVALVVAGAFIYTALFFGGVCSGSGGFYVRSDNWRNVDVAWYGPNYRYGLGHDF